MLLTLGIVSFPWQLMAGKQRQADHYGVGLPGSKRGLLEGHIAHLLNMSDMEPSCLG